ncbi:CYSTEINE-RICH RECEPTOR-LIKE PROTEIN KINASE 5 [Salix koriyanagi]|uniref:CYSTEINE-RICH RECEPTOR-LIKE PROTEIN KINASE 5 n=1 Tax=Salix koriyanagi TaxID=2511006 RepID=A0A9Q0UWY3_9ROSI|nr:CYSTEINE-RICH RECEPTOR-LIKE PROTEIN KINASE 5 [Salix koriyanagi]
MNSLKFYIILLSLLNIAIIILAQEDANYLYQICENATTSTMNSTYRVNLNLVLSSLASNATRNNINGFYNTSFGQSTDQVYGLFICRGDVSNTVCQNCVTFATKDVVQRCPIGIASIIFYDACHLRYSNRNFFSKVDQNPSFSLANTQNTTNEPQRFNNLVATSVNDSATQAASASPGAKKFAVNETYVDGFQNIYSLAQCTPDLSSFDCNKCLRAVIARLPICCSSKIGARVYSPSCYIHYEITEFYDATAVAEESVPPPPLPPVTLPVPEGKSGVSIVLIIAIVIPIAVTIVLFCMGFCFLRRRARKTTYSVPENDVEDEMATVESLQFDLSTLETATDNFSADNKLGEGGFGEVYKVWKHWRDGTPLEVLDPTLTDTYSRNEVIRCIHIGLLCVQEDPAIRPAMATIVLTLDSYSVTIPLPQEPAFFFRSTITDEVNTSSKEFLSDQSKTKSADYSVDEASITEVYPR